MAISVLCQGVHVDTEQLSAEAFRALDHMGRGDCELSVVLCDDEFIRKLNRSWRGLDTATDVLSFPQQTFAQPNEFVSPTDPTSAGMPSPLAESWAIALGDVVISVATARRQAHTMGHSIEQELRVLLVHGICHILGHDHVEANQRERMSDAEAILLAVLGGGVGLTERE